MRARSSSTEMSNWYSFSIYLVKIGNEFGIETIGTDQGSTNVNGMEFHAKQSVASTEYVLHYLKETV